MKTVVFVYSMEGLGRLLSYARREHAILVSLTPETDFFLRQNRVVFKSMRELGIKEIPYRKLYFNRVKTISKWSKIRIGDSSLYKKLYFRGIPLWDCIENEAGEVNLEKILVFADIISDIIKRLRPDRIVSANTRNIYFIPRDRVFFPEIFRSVGQDRHIDVVLFNPVTNVKALLQPLVNCCISLCSRFRSWQRRGIKDFQLSEQRPKVFFFLNGDNLDKTVPVQKELQSRGIGVVAICSDGIFSNRCLSALKKEGLMYAYYESFMDSSIRNDLRQQYSKMRRLWKKVKENKKFFVYKRINLFCAYQQQLKNFFCSKLPETAGFVLVFYRILRSLKPDLIVTANDSVIYGKAAVLSAKKAGVLSLLMQHATNLEYPSRINPVSDYTSLWSSTDLADIGADVDRRRFIVTGTPKRKVVIDQMSLYNRQKTIRELGIPGHKKIILFAARFPVTRDVFRLNDLRKILSSHRDVAAIIKLHPAETEINSNDFSRSFSSDSMIFIKNYDFVKLLSVADLVISNEECTTCSDTIMVKKPLITLCFDNCFYQPMTEVTHYPDPCPFLRAKNAEELRKHINTLLYSKRAKDLLIDRMERYDASQSNLYEDSEKIIADFIENKIKGL